MRGLKNATGILEQVAPKRALFARFLVTAMSEKVTATPTRLCLESDEVDACGIGCP